MTDASGAMPAGDLEEDGSTAGVAFEAVVVATIIGPVPWSVVEMRVTSGIEPEGGTSELTTPVVGAAFETALEGGTSVPLPLSAAEGLEAPRAAIKRVADSLQDEQIR
jgi:hypothetical protein